ncbi:MAG: hypothetical protein WBL93_00445 [Lutisporaceae bacterium]
MSRKVAFGGILTALCVVIVYIAAYLPTGKLGMYAISSLIIACAVIELGVKWGTVTYVASAALIFLLTGSINAFLLFVLFFGGYPIIKYHIEKLSSVKSEIVLKLVAINVLAITGYFIYIRLLGISPINIPEISTLITGALIIAAQAVFLIYDYVLSRLISYYMDRIRLLRP